MNAREKRQLDCWIVDGRIEHGLAAPRSPRYTGEDTIWTPRSPQGGTREQRLAWIKDTLRRAGIEVNDER